MIELVVLGLLLIFLGFILFILATLRVAKDEAKRAEAGGVLIVGPVPIVFGTSQRIATITMVLAVVLTLLSLLLFLLALWR
ncbi:TIGR00304 family membrane protein [Pyrobaculum islandicum]|uniref:TIGR00304 family membrane protein n=1 Tax=Pyrobaculum islandicum TaxID=2277 RepID=UPI0026BECFFD